MLSSRYFCGRIWLDGIVRYDYVDPMVDAKDENSISKWFGVWYANPEARIASYDYLENYIESAHLDWNKTPRTDLIAAELSKRISALSREDLAFLLCHSGFIPETYAADSSQETLFSKLVEVVVGEWARRLGFDQTTLPTRKSSVEDVTLRDADNVIVCDAKTYRLGRSQKAPNVKDTLKQGDIAKWLSQYPVEQRRGGLVTFPSQHDWSGGSDVYLYLTDKSSPILMLFYEHLSFMTLQNSTKDRMISYYKRHADLHPQAITTRQGNRRHYFNIVKTELLDCDDKLWDEFNLVANLIITERVTHAVRRLKGHLVDLKLSIRNEVSNLDKKSLEEQLVEARFAIKSTHLLRQMGNILGFRSTFDLE